MCRNKLFAFVCGNPQLYFIGYNIIAISHDAVVYARCEHKIQWMDQYNLSKCFKQEYQALS